MLRLSILALLALSLAACDPVSGDDDPPPPPGNVAPRIVSLAVESFDASTGEWQDAYASAYTYDDQGLLVEERSTRSDGTYRTSYLYDFLDRVEEVQTSTPDFPALSDLNRYDGDSDRIVETRGGNTGQSFESRTVRYLYTYDAQGRRTLEALDLRSPGADWERCSERDYLYGAGADPTQITRRGNCFFDIPLSEFTNRVRYVYAASQLSYEEFDRYEANTWDPRTRTSYTYNAVGDVSMSLLEFYLLDGSRQPAERTTYVYEDGPVAARPTAASVHMIGAGERAARLATVFPATR